MINNYCELKAGNSNPTNSEPKLYGADDQSEHCVRNTKIIYSLIYKIIY